MNAIQYMHTIDDLTGFFDGRQIVFASSRSTVKLCPDLATIRHQQQLSRQFRHKHGWDSNWADYGYKRVRVFQPPTTAVK